MEIAKNIIRNATKEIGDPIELRLFQFSFLQAYPLLFP
jgi:hypothetical protein